jgi:enoyl-CoA hydratase/carnithine racemase
MSVRYETVPVAGTAAGTATAGTATAGLITLNRPEQLNPIDSSVIAALDGAIDALGSDPTVRAVLLTGAGRAFSAGGDLKGYVELQRDPVAFPAFVTELHRVFGRLREMPVPVIALVNGVTAAGGLELLLNCDVALAARSARIGDAHQNFGMMGGGGVLTLLPRFVGIQRARELVFSGRFLDADEAASWGLVSKVVDDDALLDAGLALAAEIAAKSPLAIANAKEVMHAVWAGGMSVEAGLRLERERNAFYCLTSSDAREGLDAFSEKRPPRFTGR